MIICRTINEYRKAHSNLNGSIGFVPTMGALHDGHVSLVKRSVKENKSTVVSIFLNPTQFDNSSDLENYPKTLEQDIQQLENNGTDIIILPDYDFVYPDDYKYLVSNKELSSILCGAYREGHFDGVLTVVMKLLNIAKADNAYFGEKDYQQYLLIKGMAEAFFLDTKIISCPIIRENSGLAMSSRNERLSKDARRKASELYRIISMDLSIEDKKSKLIETGFEVEYLTQFQNRLFAAVYLEKVRLIDNVKI